MALEIGQRLTRREPQKGDAWNLIEVRGYFDLGADGGGIEIVVAPVEGGHTPVTATSQSLMSIYTLDAGPDPAAGIADGLAKLTGAPEWSTSAEELENA